MASELINLIKPGAVVYVGGSCGEPHSLLDEIEASRDQISRVHFIQQPLAAVNKRDLSCIGADSLQTTFFMTPFLKDGLAAGRVRFVPMHMRAIHEYLRNAPIDVALLQAARDSQGDLRFGPNVDYVDAVLESAKHIVIEENTSYVAPQGTRLVDLDRCRLIRKARSLQPLYPQGESDATSEEIGRLIAGLIRDGDCLQTGIGAVPAAIVSNLGDRSDLGFHGGLMDDGVMKLIEAGNITGAVKHIDKGDHVLGMALGSALMLQWLAESDAAARVIFRSANYTHEADVIRQLDNFVSINSAIEVDLMGQVNAEVAGGRQISGTGGSVDFMRAAKMSTGGRSIIAMASTARNGAVSRIVRNVEVATALRTDVDLVVTEFGVADLKNASLAERAQRLINIAHPDFRDMLVNNEGI